MKTLGDLTADDQAEVESQLTELTANGYKIQDSVGDLAPGVRIRHIGQQYPEAHVHGTGVIVAVVMRREPDVELVVAYDEPRFEGASRVTVLANYHVHLIPA